MQLSVKSNVKDVLRDYKHLSKDIKEKAMVRAINHSATKANTQLVKLISAESGLKQKRIRAKIRKIKAGRNTLTAILKPTTRLNTNLIEWVTTSQANRWLARKPGKKPPKGVTANAWRSRRMYRGTFVIRGKFSGKPIVLKRKGKKTSTVYGPAVWSEFRHYSRQEASKAVDKYFNKEFERQVKLLVSKQKK